MKLFSSKKPKKVKNQPEDSFFDYQALGEEDKSDIINEDETEKDVEVKSERDDWLNEDYEEGQLSVDVYQTKKAIVIKSTIAGVKPENIDISINNDMVTIRGKREVEQTVAEEDYFYQECYWGGFSRSIILPVEIRPDKSEASLKNGVLTITLPKADKSKTISVRVEDKDV
ncbi:Hsp20/alpha crystallin family protein [Patescibacteria group bacterium]|nr:Hsp20/alpha crystallin family protein [Patescibacteria group bacterium]